MEVSPRQTEVIHTLLAPRRGAAALYKISQTGKLWKAVESWTICRDRFTAVSNPHPTFGPSPEDNPMSVNAEAAPQISDVDKLVAVLQTCFGELLRKQEEQGARLYRAVDALKPPVPTADKKTAFWNTYMKLADEHDKEFREKYGTDLDTALIFAGLFSAVSSAFIIQIQSLLVHNVRTVIVVVQALQYISLFTALLAALLAVLGKQWIMYYNTAGSRGTIEERGLERQRKLDGLVKWKFEAVLQMFPLLLQLALLLFATSISVYLFTVHLSIAIIVLVLTVAGFGAYLFLLISATIYPDCPFQTPLTPLLVHVVSPVVDWLQCTIHAFNGLRSAMTESLRTTRPVRLLPRFASKEPSAPTSSDMTFTPPSPEVPAVLWTLGTSTDPITISTAAELGFDLQWPAQWDPQSARIVTTRLADAFSSCFGEPLLSDAVRKGREQIAFPVGDSCTPSTSSRAPYLPTMLSLYSSGEDWQRSSARTSNSFAPSLTSVQSCVSATGGSCPPLDGCCISSLGRSAIISIRPNSTSFFLNFLLITINNLVWISQRSQTTCAVFVHSSGMSICGLWRKWIRAIFATLS
ncbi:hypothetical protein C8R46DRAFT_445047 [Mycena filopes]|nr:hypothetical protein C8R46DRAFT_445047 [Mycena filopes]